MPRIISTSSPSRPSTNNSLPQPQKYTVQSTGIWERIRRLLAVDSTRSTGIPLNPQFRYPAPGALAPESYTDPVTLPAGDIADNAYFKRDVRRNYPRPSVIGQGQVVGLLSVGSKAEPKEEVLRIGAEGEKQIVALKEEGEKGLGVYFKGEGGVQAAKSVLGPDGLPPMPVSIRGNRYEMTSEQGYPSQ